MFRVVYQIVQGSQNLVWEVLTASKADKIIDDLIDSHPAGIKRSEPGLIYFRNGDKLSLNEQVNFLRD
jgi:hypothetical protein